MKARFLIAAALTAASPALANDSTAERAAGGLVLTKSAEIDMVSEDLFISAEAVRVRYLFRNRSGRDVTTLVAFPLPDRDLSEEWYGDVAYPADFRTSVDGRLVPMTVERKAFARGVDRTAELERLGALTPKDEGYEAMERALAAAPAADRARLLRLGLVREEDEGETAAKLVPAWTVRETWYWEQSFPADRDLLVEHSYTPGTGGSVGTPLVLRDFRRSAEGRAMIARYCADADFLAGIDRLARGAGGDYPTLPEQRISYVLKTGANWRAPIGTFRLTVDKGAPDNLVSFCGEGVRKTGSTRFEMVKTNWRPDRDLDILIVQPQPR